MRRKQEETVTCQICHMKKTLSEVSPAAIIPEPIVEIVKKTNPDWFSPGFICITDLNRFREEYVKDVLSRGKGEVSVLEEQVIKSMKEHELLSTDINAEFDRKLTFNEHIADRMACTR